MALSSVASGTQTATVTTEHTLATQTAAGWYTLVVDTVNMVADDVLILKFKTKCLTGGVSRLAYQAMFAHVQEEQIKYSVPVPIDIELVVTLTQSEGTSRDFPWSLLKS